MSFIILCDLLLLLVLFILILITVIIGLLFVVVALFRAGIVARINWGLLVGNDLSW